MLQSAKKTHAAHQLTANYTDTNARAEVSAPEIEGGLLFLLYTPGTEATGLELEIAMSNPEGAFGFPTDVDAAGAVTLRPNRTVAKPGGATLYIIDIDFPIGGAVRIGVIGTGVLGATPGTVDIWVQGVGAGF